MRRALGSLAILVILVFATNAIAGRAARSWDLTGEGSASLSRETLRMLHRLDRRIEITAVFERNAVGRVEAATLLSRYRKANRKITFKIVDPTVDPGVVAGLGIAESGSAAVKDLSQPRRVEIAQYTIEIDITSAIARLVRPSGGTVCFSTGHGESPRSDDPEGVSEASKLLVDNAYEVRTIDLLTHPSVPKTCVVLVIAAATDGFDKDATAAVVTYLERSGKAFVLADPASDFDPTRLVSRWGISFDRGVVVEGDPDSHLPNDLTTPVIRRFSDSSPPVRGLGPVFFPRIEAVDAKGTSDPGLTVAEVASTSQLAYLDREDSETFDASVDRKGPVPVAAAADDSEVSAPGSSKARILRTRIFAIGDVDFATNKFVEQGSNARLFLQVVDWLALPEDVVTAVPAFPAVRDLELTEARSRYILMLMAGIVPGLFVIAGAMVWVIRRGR